MEDPPPNQLDLPPNALRHASRSRSPLVSPASPASKRILVVVTVDAERYTPVDLTDVLDEGPVIRRRIYHKVRLRSYRFITLDIRDLIAWHMGHRRATALTHLRN